MCHGSTRQGGLDLSPDAAHSSLVDVPSSGSRLDRVEPGEADSSYLYLKLAAKTRPGSVEIQGTSMPEARPAISETELQAIREWILAGAPKTGAVAGTDRLLSACLPPPAPIVITPLEPPPIGEGVQLVMPEWPLRARSEREVCIASYYDLSAQVPKEFQDESGTQAFVASIVLRQDPQSHHLSLNRYIGKADVHDPAFGVFTCKGGSMAGELCEPTDAVACGGGICSGPVRDGVGCIGVGPQDGGQTYLLFASALETQSSTVLPEGVYTTIPLRGVLYWNAHAFNLTESDGVMHARVNLIFAEDPRHLAVSILAGDRIFDQHTPPFETETLCSDLLLPRGARLIDLRSHTHKRGEHFTVHGPDGSLLYENFDYRDPVNRVFEPPLAFDSPDPRERNLHYCARYNNGVAPDGSPNVASVKRRSSTPDNAPEPCRPVACVSGKVGATCQGEGDDRACDSTPGANDGFCDACVLTGGYTTEDEMFLLLGSLYVLPPSP